VETSYRILLFLHVVTVLIAFGVTFAWPFLQAAAERAGTGQTKFALRLMRRVDDMVTGPGAILTLLFGVGLIFNDITGYSDDMPAWLELSLGLFIIIVIVAVAVQRRTVGRAMEVLASVPDSDPLPDSYRPLSKQMQRVGGAMALGVLFITFLMTYKPTLWD
jgi:uncharacterized membrane protein